uniref:Ion_trans domain-containing protein n=1 Tax=Panagrellus redivivus TaxID=6233 RepID=A0A7E4V4J5_PANRE
MSCQHAKGTPGRAKTVEQDIGYQVPHFGLSFCYVVVGGMAVAASSKASTSGNNEVDVEAEKKTSTSDDGKVSEPGLCPSNDSAGSRFAAVVRVAVKVKHWLTGRADVDNHRERLKTDFIMLGFFNAMYTANNGLLSAVSTEVPPDLTTREGIQKLLKQLKTAFTSSIDDTASTFYYWSLIVTLACFYNFLSIPLTIYAEFQSHYFVQWLIGGWFADVVNIVDLWFQARREFLDDGVRHTHWKKTLKHYTKSFIIYLDLIALLPTDLMLLIYPLWGFCRLNRLLKIHRVSDFLERTEIRTNFPNMFRLFRLICICFVIFHWNGCFYFLVSIAYKYENLNVDDWAFSFDKIFNAIYPDCDARFVSQNCSVIETFEEWANREDRLLYFDAFFANRTKTTNATTLVRKYMLSFYWSALTLTTLGEQPWPNDSFETLYETVDTLFGLIIFAVIVGDVGAMVTAMNLTRTNFEERLDGSKSTPNFDERS